MASQFVLRHSMPAQKVNLLLPVAEPIFGRWVYRGTSLIRNPGYLAHKKHTGVKRTCFCQLPMSLVRRLSRDRRRFAVICDCKFARAPSALSAFRQHPLEDRAGARSTSRHRGRFAVICDCTSARAPSACLIFFFATLEPEVE